MPLNGIFDLLKLLFLIIQAVQLDLSSSIGKHMALDASAYGYNVSDAHAVGVILFKYLCMSL